MADSSEEPRTLKQISHRAEQRRRAIESSSFVSNPNYAEDLKAAIEAQHETIRAVSRVDLFSPNEPLEDIATPDLPFLLPEYQLAELYQKTPMTTPDHRKAALGEAREAYERFLGLLDGFEILKGPYRTLYARYTDDPSTFSTVSAASGDAARQRDAKIANFKAEKALKERMESLKQNPRYGEDGQGGDEEIVRELHITQLQYAAHMAFQGLEGINREMEMLAQAPAMRPLIPAGQGDTAEEDARRRRAAEQSSSSERLEPKRLHSILSNQGGPLLTKKGKPLQPFTLVGSRAEAAEGVFRPGHRLPTMSVDEYLEEERRRGGIIEGGGEASYNRPEPDEDDFDKADEDTYKARAWDEFVEANPKGAGNTLNMG